MNARAWAALVFGPPVTLTDLEAARMLSAIRAAVSSGTLPVQDAAELARRVLAAAGGPGLFSA